MGKTMKIKTPEGLEIVKRIVALNNSHEAACEQLQRQFESDMQARSENYRKEQTRNMAGLCKAEHAAFPVDSTALDARYFSAHGDAYLFDMSKVDEEEEPVVTVDRGGQTLQ